MKILKYHIVAIALLSCTVGMAQQLPQFTQYMYNTMSINPAYTGSRETLSVVGLHRSQWVGIEGAPTTQTLSVSSPLDNEKMGIGGSFIHDELGAENFNYLYASFSYTIKTGENSKLAFGINAGFTQYSLDQDFRLENPNDPVIYGIEDRWDPNIGAGLYWHSTRWYVGLSTPRILNNNYATNGYEALERISYYLTGGYVFNLGDYTKFKPAFLIKATNGAPLSYDLTANFLFYEKLWLGAGFRNNSGVNGIQTNGVSDYTFNGTNAIGALIDFQVSKQIRIGYTYEFPINSEIKNYQSGTHEIMLMFELFKERRIKSPRYF
ncbi:type IX secretion system membrane protein PorP/SprF [Formosa sp. PL04]|uniref:PorP/SprF family type IX secretion system membrane protein n=1 Tax=Formosa sp. PL04 TaxID=3081755 RepID=UPI002982B7C2|nr:type IX secretion system membrane protein PorP/SprF [Formosa sp. PL04]MDW5289384.1 type IX secretion system membrane protein PorP/SprF [Formosa sp. PL04]